MIGTLDIQCNANNPNIALKTIYSFINSPSSIRVLNVPKKIGNWKIEKVFITAQYPDNKIKSVETKLIGGCYVGTIQGSSVSGKTTNGFTITADGIDENGNSVRGYVLGSGDIAVLENDSTITVGETTYYLHLLDSTPQTPHKGDTVIDSGMLKIYNGTEWITISGGAGGESYWNNTSGMLTPKSDISSVYISSYTIIDNLSSDSIPTKTSELSNDSGFLSADQFWYKDEDEQTLRLIDEEGSIMLVGCDVNVNGDAIGIQTDESIGICVYDGNVSLNANCSQIYLDGVCENILVNTNEKLYVSTGCIEIYSNEINIQTVDQGYGCNEITVGETIRLDAGSCTSIEVNSCSRTVEVYATGFNFNGVCVATIDDIPDVPTKVSQLENDSGYISEHQSLTAYATKSEVSTNYVKKVNGTANDIVLFDSLGKIKDSNKNISEIADKSDLNYDYYSECTTSTQPCINAHDGQFFNVCYVEPNISVYVYLGDVDAGKVSDRMVQFNYSNLTSDSQLPQIDWRTSDGGTSISWQSIEGDQVKAGSNYLYMVQVYNNYGEYNGIMSIRKLNSGLSAN